MSHRNKFFRFLSKSFLLWMMSSLAIVTMVPMVYSQEKENHEVDEDQSDIIKFDVGGSRFKVARSTIENSDSDFLKNMISEKFNRKKDKEGYQFIDRDKKSFEYLLHFIRNLNLSDKALRNINDAHAAAIYFSSQAMIDATIKTGKLSCHCGVCEIHADQKKIEIEKVKKRKEKRLKKFLKSLELSFETDLAVKINGQQSIKHYYWSKVLPEKHPWPDTEEKRNSLCPPPSRLPTKAEYKALGKKMRSAGAYNPDYFVTNKTDRDQHQSFRQSFPWSSESVGNYDAWNFFGNYGNVFYGNRSSSEAIRCVVVVD